MAAILQTTFPNALPSMKIFEFRLYFHWSFEVCSKGSNWQKVNIGLGNILVSTSDKPLPEPMMTHFSDAYIYMLHPASIIVNELRATKTHIYSTVSIPTTRRLIWHRNDPQIVVKFDRRLNRIPLLWKGGLNWNGPKRGSSSVTQRHSFRLLHSPSLLAIGTPKFDLVYHFIQILLGLISKPPIFSM